MEYQSEKFSIRAQDGISYNAILSQIYFLLYKEFSSFLPLSSQIAEVKGNFIKQELIKNLNEQKFPEKILNVYADNKEFFEKGNEIMDQKYPSGLPWKKTTLMTIGPGISLIE